MPVFVTLLKTVTAIMRLFSTEWQWFWDHCVKCLEQIGPKSTSVGQK